MTEKKISELEELLESAPDDEIVINDASEVGSGNKITKRIKLSNLDVGGGLSEIVKDTTPQLGGDLDLNDKNITVKFPPSSDDTASGIIVTMTVDTNAEGIGAPLAMAADGHLDTADADSVDNMPCIALALETGTGSKKVLLYGVMRNDDWNWTTGAGAAGLVYVSTTVGTLTQTKPTGEDDVVQAVGWALSADVIFFCPSMMWITHI